MSTKRTGDKFIRIATDLARGVLYMLAFSMLLWLNWQALSYGGQWHGGMGKGSMLLLRLVLFAVVIVLSLAAGVVGKRLCEQWQWTEAAVVTLCALAFWGVCRWWAVSVPYSMEGDQLIVWYNSVLALEGDFSMYTKGGQMFIYPQQQGLSFLYELLFRLSGTTDPVFIGRVNALLAPFTLIFGYLCLKECSDRACAMRFLPFLMLCLPYIVYSPYVYGDIPSICFSFVLLWAVLRLMEGGRPGYGVIACVVASLALLSRMNIWIFFIALAIGLGFLAIRRRSFKPLIWAVCILLCASLSMTAVKQFNSHRSGEPVSEGMPSVLWMAMGLQFSEYGAGYYNHYSKGVFQDVDFDREAAAQVGIREVKDRIKVFLSEPYQARLFFEQKLRLQWMDPMFESLKFTGTFAENNPPEGVVDWAYRGQGYSRLHGFGSHMLAIVYFFAMVGVIYRFFEKKDIYKDVPLIAFVGGFLFSIFWEAKARYMLPYYVLLMMYAAHGVTRVSQTVYKNLKKTEPLEIGTEE